VDAGLDLGFDDAQQAIADAVGQFCEERCTPAAVRAQDGRFPAELWRELAELGVLALLTPEAEGGAVELVAALEPLGRAAFPGPLAASFFATQVLPEAERREVAAGRAVVSVGAPPLLPWAPCAQIFLELDGATVHRAEPRGAVAPVDTLGGEPWGRVELRRVAELAGASRARLVFGIAAAAYLASAGLRLVEDTAAHARTRRQFGRPIGEFQAVSHPLADAWIQLEGARGLARAAAWHLDQSGEAPARALAAAALVCARREAVSAAHRCHQLFGAIGITVDGPAWFASRRIRQLASLPAGCAEEREALLRHFGL